MNWRWSLAGFFGGAFLLTGGFLFTSSYSKDKVAQELQRPVPPGAIRSMATVGGANSFQSLHFKQPCVAFHTRVTVEVETQAEDGTVDRDDYTCFDQNRGSDPIPLDIQGRRLNLPLNLWSHHAPTRMEALQACPVYARENKDPGTHRYRVAETILREGQALFVAAILVLRTWRPTHV